MASIGITTVREQYPDKTDQEAAAIMSREAGYCIVVRYKLFPDGPYCDFGLCRTYQEADGYFDNRNLHGVETIYDHRNDRSIKPQMVVHNKAAVGRNITFGPPGHASEPCCYNCRHYGAAASGDPFCSREQWTGGNPTLVDQADLCGSWSQRTIF